MVHVCIIFWCLKIEFWLNKLNSQIVLDLKSYINSGILELYALDLLNETERFEVEAMLSLHEELRAEYELIQKDLEKYAVVNSIEPSPPLHEVIVDSILNLQKEKVMDPADLPIINKYSSHINWQKLANSLGEIKLTNGKYEKVLRHDDKVLQVFVVTENDIEEETHEQEYESFLVLSGECSCTIGSDVNLMGPGDFMEIPLHELHDVKLVSKSVTAILQRIKVSF